MLEQQVNAAAGGPGAPQGWGGGAPGGGYGGPPAGGGWGGPPAGGGYGYPPAGGQGGPPAGAYGGPPQAAGQIPPDVAELDKKVHLWFVLSIVSLFVGCGILAIIPIMKANSAKDAMHRQDYARAASDIGTAKLLCIFGFAFFACIFLFYVVFFVALRMAFF